MKNIIFILIILTTFSYCEKKEYKAKIEFSENVLSFKDENLNNSIKDKKEVLLESIIGKELVLKFQNDKNDQIKKDIEIISNYLSKEGKKEQIHISIGAEEKQNEIEIVFENYNRIFIKKTSGGIVFMNSPKEIIYKFGYQELKLKKNVNFKLSVMSCGKKGYRSTFYELEEHDIESLKIDNSMFIKNFSINKENTKSVKNKNLAKLLDRQYTKERLFNLQSATSTLDTEIITSAAIEMKKERELDFSIDENVSHLCPKPKTNEGDKPPQNTIPPKKVKKGEIKNEIKKAEELGRTVVEVKINEEESILIIGGYVDKKRLEFRKDISKNEFDYDQKLVAKALKEGGIKAVEEYKRSVRAKNPEKVKNLKRIYKKICKWSSCQKVIWFKNGTFEPININTYRIRAGYLYNNEHKYMMSEVKEAMYDNCRKKCE